MKIPQMRAARTLSHSYQVIAVLLLTASVWVLCWYLASLDLIDLAATGFAFLALQLVRQIGGSLASRAPKELRPTATLLDQARIDFQEWSKSRTLVTQFGIALAVTIVWLLGRFLAATVMHAIASPWLALSVGLGIAACVCSPVLIRGIVDQFNRAKPTDAAESAAPAERKSNAED